MATWKAVQKAPEGADRAGRANMTKTSAIAVARAMKAVDAAAGMAIRRATQRLLAGAGSALAMAKAAGTAIRRVILAPPAEGRTKAAKEKGLTVPGLGMRTKTGKATRVAEVLQNMTTSDALRAAEAEAIATEIGS
jgi:hypothetical protein